jgi:hypothetical protein
LLDETRYWHPWWRNDDPLRLIGRGRRQRLAARPFGLGVLLVVEALADSLPTDSSEAQVGVSRNLVVNSSRETERPFFGPLTRLAKHCGAFNTCSTTVRKHGSAEESIQEGGSHHTLTRIPLTTATGTIAPRADELVGERTLRTGVTSTVLTYNNPGT